MSGITNQGVKSFESKWDPNSIVSEKVGINRDVYDPGLSMFLRANAVPEVPTWKATPDGPDKPGGLTGKGTAASNTLAGNTAKVQSSNTVAAPNGKLGY